MTESPSGTPRPGPPDPDTRPGWWALTPLWVRVFLLIGATFLFLLAVMLVSGHDPTRHMEHGMGHGGLLA